MSQSKKDAGDYSKDEAAKRRDDALRRALMTPPSPKKTKAGKPSGSKRAVTRAKVK